MHAQAMVWQVAHVSLVLLVCFAVAVALHQFDLLYTCGSSAAAIPSELRGNLSQEGLLQRQVAMVAFSSQFLAEVQVRLLLTVDCVAGTMGLKGQLTSGEIIEQLVHAVRVTQIRNIVFMVSSNCTSYRVTSDSPQARACAQVTSFEALLLHIVPTLSLSRQIYHSINGPLYMATCS